MSSDSQFVRYSSLHSYRTAFRPQAQPSSLVHLPPASPKRARILISGQIGEQHETIAPRAAASCLMPEHYRVGRPYAKRPSSWRHKRFSHFQDFSPSATSVPPICRSSLHLARLHITPLLRAPLLNQIAIFVLHQRRWVHSPSTRPPRHGARPDASLRRSFQELRVALVLSSLLS